MSYCYVCGEPITFYHDGFQAIPVHASGSCSGRRDGYDGGGGYSYVPTDYSVRTTETGTPFYFLYPSFPSYVNPNATCPVCGADVYFYQSPYGGRVFFDDLGPPWPKHPCTDTSEMQSRFAKRNSYDAFRRQTQTHSTATATVAVENNKSPEWLADGWMPFVVRKITAVTFGVQVDGELYETSDGEPTPFQIEQRSVDAMYYRRQGEVFVGFNVVQNSSLVLSVLTACPIMLQRDPEMHQFKLSSFLISKNSDVEEIKLHVVGRRVEKTWTEKETREI